MTPFALGFWFALASFQQLDLGVPSFGSVGMEDTHIEEADRSSGEITFLGHGDRWLISIPSAGTFTVTLTSHDFDAYLVLRDEKGAILASDDDGKLGPPATHSRVSFQTTSAGNFSIDACRLWNLNGDYTLLVESGPPPKPSIAELNLLLAEDSENWVERATARGTDQNVLAFANLRHARDNIKISDYPAAAVAAEAAWQLLEKLYPQSSNALTAQSVFAYAEFLNQRYDIATAIYQSAYAKAIALDGENSPEAFALCISLAESTYQGGDLPKALQILLDQEKRLQTIPNQVPLAVAYLHMALGRFYHYQDKAAKALPHLEAAAEGFRQASPPDPEGLAKALLNLGALVSSQGDISRARALLEESLQWNLQTLGQWHPDVAYSQNELAFLLFKLGDYAPARKLYEESFLIRQQALGENHLLTAEVLANLAQLDLNQRKLPAAKTKLSKALAIAEASGPAALKRIPLYRLNLGFILRREGKLAEAMEMLELAHQASLKVFGPHHSSTALIQGHLGSTLYESGKTEEAIAMQTEAIATWNLVRGKHHPSTATAVGALAQSYWKNNQLAEAWKLSQETYADMANYIRRLYWSMTESERQMHLIGHQTGLDSLIALARAQGNPQALGIALDALLLAKGRIQRSLLESRDRWLTNTSPAAKQALQELQKVKAKLSNVMHVQSLVDLGQQKAEVVALRAEQARVERTLVQLAGKTKEPIPSVSWTAIQDALPEQSLAIEFSFTPTYTPQKGWGENHLLAWIIARDQSQPALFDLGPAEPIGALLDKLIPKDRGGRSLSTQRLTTEAELGKIIWKPMEGMIAETEIIFLSPDGFLGKLPFEILQPEKDVFLVERHAFVYLDSLSHLPTILSRPPPSKLEGPLLAVGDVQYNEFKQSTEGDSEANRGTAKPNQRAAAVSKMSFIWNALEFSGQEAEEIFRLHKEMLEWQGGSLIEKTVPTEAYLKRTMPEFKYLHLATHGFFMGDRARSIKDALKDSRERKSQKGLYQEKQMLGGLVPGLLCGLVLAGANGARLNEGEDGYLTAEEIRFIDLTNCEMAVLSACETSLGSLRNGEGMISLRRSFHLAGAHSVLASLWKVDDESTQRLMEDFYRNWWWYGDMTRLEAIQQARLGLLEEQREEGLIDPKKWGAFILSGDWR